jgi:hypothetical protein
MSITEDDVAVFVETATVVVVVYDFDDYDEHKETVLCR